MAENEITGTESDPPTEEAEQVPRVRDSKLVWVLGGVVVVLVLLVAGVAWKTTRGDSSAHYCKVYDETHPQLLAAGDKAKVLKGSYDDLTASISRMDDLFKQRRDAAPAGEIRDAYDTMLAGKPDSSQPLSVTTAYQNAPDVINAYTERVCKLPGDL